MVRLPLSLFVATAIAHVLCVAEPLVGVHELPPANQNSELLRRAREAMGGDACLRRVTSLILQGTVASGFDAGRGAPSQSEAAIELRMRPPDFFLRIESHPQLRSRKGFKGTVPINSVTPVGDTVVGTDNARPDLLLKLQRRKFAELALGLLAETQTAMPLRVERGGNGARSLKISGPDGFSATLDFDPTTGLPASLRFRQLEVFPRPITADERRNRVVPPLPAPEDVEVAIIFDERRPVDRLLLPFRVRRIARGMTLEEIRVQRYILNPAPERLESK